MCVGLTNNKCTYIKVANAIDHLARFITDIYILYYYYCYVCGCSDLRSRSTEAIAAII